MNILDSSRWFKSSPMGSDDWADYHGFRFITYATILGYIRLAITIIILVVSQDKVNLVIV